MGRPSRFRPNAAEVFLFFFFIPFSFYLNLKLYSNLIQLCGSSFINSIFAIKNTKPEDIYLYILFIFSYLFSFPYFQTLISI
jgi:hypothetical protein